MNIIASTITAAVGCTQALADLHSQHLAESCAAYDITTPDRLAAYFAQIGHESGSLHYVREIASGAAYENRADLCNTHPGDGERFPGRGWLQCTGRGNYVRARDALRGKLGEAQVPDFEAWPEAVEQPKWAAWVSAWWWAAHGCNELADAGAFIALGRLINRGNAASTKPANGEADRITRWERAREAMGLSAGPTAVDQPQAAPTPPPAPIEAPRAVAPAEPVIPAALHPTSSPASPMKGIAMGATFLWGLAQSLIASFAPLAQEKITKEIARHTDNATVADQVATGIVDAAKAITGHDDPIQAVAAAKADPVAVQKIEADALDTIDRLTPMLDKMATWQQAGWTADEASMSAAAERAKGHPNDQDKFLTRATVGLIVGLLVGVGILIIVLAKMDLDVGDLKTFLITIGALAAGAFKTRIDHRYGAAHKSVSSDVVLGELAHRQKP